MKLNHILFLILFSLVSQTAFALPGSYGSTNQDSVSKFLNWYNLDPKADGIMGVSTQKAYEKILKDKPSKTVLVAIIDSGIDILHEDLREKIWINSGEIAGNEQDDDENGYVDDVHGWNFIGGPDGQHIVDETLEVTRIYKRLNDKFGRSTESTILPEQKQEYATYLMIKEEFENEVDKAKKEKLLLTRFDQNFSFADSMVTDYLQKDNYDLVILKSIEAEDPALNAAKNYIVTLYENGFTKEIFSEMVQRNEEKLQVQFNPDFDARSRIVGDDPENLRDWQYGNNDVDGKRSEHGTHVAGIIGAVRNNGLGIDGVADNVKMMVLRAVPNGDERDKDIANAIIYAVNNGAQIINMSFGKGYSPQKHAVDSAVQIAEARGVLLIHSAGNSAENNDKKVTYPTKVYSNNKGAATNWITVGASSMYANEELIAPFSNYGKTTVDIFAPGVDIYSAMPDNKYAVQSGTSMAGPVVTGVAAMLMSYYPELTAQEVKRIIIASAYKQPKLKVIQPGKVEGKELKVKLKDLSVGGGIINAYNAAQMAEKLSKQKVSLGETILQVR